MRQFIVGVLLCAFAAAHAEGACCTNPGGNCSDPVAGVCPAGSTLCADCVCGDAQYPVILDDSIIARELQSLVIHGGGFLGTTPSVTFTGPVPVTYTPSSPNIVSWTDARIELTVPVGITSAYTVSVTAGALTSAQVPVYIYRYRKQAIAGTGFNPRATQPKVSPYNSRAYLNVEFGVQFFSSPADASSITTHSPGNPTTPFFQIDPSGAASQSSNLGEDTYITSDGDVWFTQGGGALSWAFLYTPSYGRIVRYTPGTGAFQCYHLQQAQCQPSGMVVVGTTLWVTCLNGVTGKLLEIPIIAGTACGGTTVGVNPPWFAAYTTHTASGVGFGHVVSDGAGTLWLTPSWSPDLIASYNIGAGTFKYYPMPQYAPNTFGVPGFNFPWNLIIDAQGFVWFTLHGPGFVVRWNAARALSTTDCDALSGGLNPCIVEVLDSGLDSIPHGIDIDTSGNVWWSTHGDGKVWRRNLNGYTHSMASDSPAASIADKKAGAGMALNNGDPSKVWFAEYNGDTSGGPTLTSYLGQFYQIP